MNIKEFENVDYPQKFDADFSKYFENAEYDYLVTEKLKSVAQEQTDKSLAKAFALISLVSSADIQCHEDKYILAPFAVMNGMRTFIPCDLDNKDKGFLDGILKDVKPVQFKAKVADVLWESTKRKNYAVEAESKYFQFIQTDKPWCETREYWGRLLYISKKIKSQILCKIKEEAFKKMSSEPTDISFQLWACSHLLSVDDLTDNEDAFKKICANLKNFYGRKDVFISPDFERTISLIKQISSKDSDEILDVLVLTQISFADEIADKESIRAGLLYDSAIHFLQQISDKNGYDVENRKIKYALRRQEIRRNGIKDYELISRTIEIGPLVQETIESFKKIDDKWRALLSLANLTAFSQIGFESLNKNVKDLMGKMLYLILGCSNTTIDSSGKVVSKHNGIDFKKPLEEQDAFLQQRATYFRDYHVDIYSAAYVIPALRTIVEDFQYTEDELLSVIRQNTSIQGTQQYAFVHGFYLFLKGDIFAAIHILAPAIEAHVRDIFVKNEWKSTYLATHELDQNLVLGSLIKDFKPFIQKYGEPTYFMMYSIFCDKNCANLRNDIAHGEFFPSEKRLNQAAYAIAFILRFIIFDDGNV